jgi:hypothetical protein
MQLYLYNTNDPKPIPEQYAATAKEISKIVEVPDASLNGVIVAGSYCDIDTIVLILKKLRHNGTAVLEGPDIFEISRSVISGYLNGESVRQIVGNQEKLYSLAELIQIINQLPEFEILHKRINHYRYSLTVKRK